MKAFDREILEPYLSGLFHAPVTILSIVPLGQPHEAKGYGYGVPILVDLTAGGARRRVVVETMSAGPFGHEHRSDRLSIRGCVFLRLGPQRRSGIEPQRPGANAGVTPGRS